MSNAQAIKAVKSVLSNEGRIPAIRFVRLRLGLTFKTAQTMVREIQEGASWYK